MRIWLMPFTIFSSSDVYQDATIPRQITSRGFLSSSRRSEADSA
jgi:hypothetical protein